MNKKHLVVKVLTVVFGTLAGAFGVAEWIMDTKQEFADNDDDEEEDDD